MGTSDQSPGCSHSSSPGHAAHAEEEPKMCPIASSDEEDLDSRQEEEKTDEEDVDGGCNDVFIQFIFFFLLIHLADFSGALHSIQEHLS